MAGRPCQLLPPKLDGAAAPPPPECGLLTFCGYGLKVDEPPELLAAPSPARRRYEVLAPPTVEGPANWYARLDVLDVCTVGT